MTHGNDRSVALLGRAHPVGIMFAAILFGGLILLFPAAGALSLVWLLGSFAIAFGAFLIMLGWRLRNVDRMARIDAAHDYGASV